MNVEVAGNVFEVRFRPSSEPIEQVARNFWIEQQNLLGYSETNPLTEGNIQNCVGPIARYLQTSIQQFQQTQQ